MLFLTSLSAQAQTSIYGIGTLTRTILPFTSPIYPAGAPAGSQGIASFNPATGSPNSTLSLISGLVGNQKLVGIDFRPLTGQLYALGYDPALTTNNAQLYTLDPKSGVVIAVSVAPITLALGDATERIGFNFNPVADLVRVVSSNDANYRVSPITALPVATDGTLAYAAGDPNAPRNPRISGAAYTNPYAGTTSTILYDVENLDDASAPSGVLSSQSPPNDGTLNTQGSIRLGSGPTGPFFGIDATARINVDIFWAGTYNKGYLLELTAPDVNGLSNSNLYDLSLPVNTLSPSDPGNTTPVGYGSNKRNMVPANSATPFNLLSIAVAPTPAITSLSPPSAEVGTPGLTLTVIGTGFVNGTTVQFNGSDRATTYVSATQLRATLTTADLATVGTYNVTVTNPPFPGVPTAPATFTVTPTCAAPTNLAASNVTSNSATVSFTGNGSATSYTVTTSPTTPPQTLSGSATSVSFSGLTPNTTYTVNITTTCPSGTTGPASVMFTTSAAAATLAVSQGGTSYPSGGTAYNFGNQTVNTTSPAVAFTLTNSGTDPLIISTITTTGDFAVNGTPPTTVPAGGTATVNVTFTPTATGTRAGTLVVNSNASNGATYTVNLTGNGQAAAAATLAVSQGGTSYPSGGAAYSFGNQTVNTTSPAVAFTLTNSGNSALAISSITTTGDYAVSGTSPTTVPAGGTATVNVTFTPTATGTRPGTLVINSNASNGATYTVNLTGNGSAAPAPTLAVTQAGTSYPSGGTAYSFGNQTVNTTSPAVAFTLTNSGNSALAISSITATADFAVNGTPPTTVPAGGTATVNVTFTPTATGTRAGTLVINSNASNGATYTVNLTGNGQAAILNPQIAVSQGGTGIANGGTFSGFASTQQGSTSAPVTFTISNGSSTDALTLGAFTFSGPYTLSGAVPTSVAPGGTATFNVTFSPTATGANTGSVSIANNSQTNSPYVINFSGQGTSQDLVVSNAQAVQGSYRNVTIVGPNGVATLSGTLTVSGTLAVQTGGSLIQNCQTINGGGNFDLQAGGAIAICDPAGIATTGATGAVQVTGTRNFSPQASYLYNGTVAQITGPGLPAQVLNLGVLNPANVTLSQAVAVAGVVRLQSGSLNTGGRTLTLLSSAAGTALVDNSGGGAVVGTATVQRYIDPSINGGRGYRHYSSPVANSTVGDLSTATYTPVVNPAYNTLGSSVTPFPTVFGYDETRVNTSGNASPIDFDKGYFSPNTLGDALEVTRGYTVNIPGTETVDFVGNLNNGSLATPTLTRGSQTQSGWQLRGNPYPSPLDWAKVIGAGRAVNIENALYVFKSTGQYAGNYTSYVNGQSTNSGTNVLPLGQGFFVRVQAGQTTGSIAFANADRLTTPDNTPFQRGTTDSRTQLALALGNGTSRTQTVMYFETGATSSFDRAFDARSLASPSGLVLATENAPAEPLSINGQPLLTGADVLLPLRLAATTTGTYTLAVDNLANLPTGYHAYLRDALTGTYTDLATTATLSLSLTANAPAGGRYAVLFSTQPRVLATAPAALAQLASVYPNPAHGTATLLLPMALRGTAATAVSVIDNLGRTVLTRTLAAGTAETLELPLGGLAAGVYSVQARTAVGLVAKRLVVE
ncbi:choice-of-anchor D domain-containing protein [Hymenobacter sp. UYCo722]|uniref:choice-of-anchor D domain-containing protein n=1 Tax=Hymenobacter sp. UYCo722 TaxID=3156335 RepID=UPI00339B4870